MLDEVVPADLVASLKGVGFQVAAFPEEWRSLGDGAVLGHAASAGYDWLITCDKQMPFQQNLAGKALTVMILPTPQVPKLERMRDAMCAVLRNPFPGHFIVLNDEGRPSGRPTAHMIGRARKNP